MHLFFHGRVILGLLLSSQGSRGQKRHKNAWQNAIASGRGLSSTFLFFRRRSTTLIDASLFFLSPSAPSLSPHSPIFTLFSTHAHRNPPSQAALGNEALREVAKRERERLRAVKRARAEELKRLKATEDKDFATDQVRGRRVKRRSDALSGS